MASTSYEKRGEADFRARYLKLANDSQPAVEHPKPDLAFRALKRGFDVAASLAGLVVLSPLLLGTAVAVKATSPGPAIFKQERYGRDKRPFTCYKFRSMTVDTPSDVPTRVMHEDRSVMTPIGAALRRTSIDELPQLVNIVKGDMSAVPLPMFARHPHRCSARLGVSGRARMSLVSVQSSNLPERPVVEETAAFLGVVPLCL